MRFKHFRKKLQIRKNLHPTNCYRPENSTLSAFLPSKGGWQHPSAELGASVHVMVKRKPKWVLTRLDNGGQIEIQRCRLEETSKAAPNSPYDMNPFSSVSKAVSMAIDNAFL
ncbi:hypothetical protein CEXT_437571 [Caerostris extrusa]|uniref:Uncharacterized protein n=1 Tax=Caerostris extrusa TaxID=172846 RepID=A0AAV4U931_CAEEX|nr:hypothetical protein CEXT_437571 [Caerostris extrusa]